ncbi:hypothetical protein BU26DRAFT_392479, partial [Trematosphaeria pertusa]
LRELPSGFETAGGRWAWVSYETPSVAAIPGSFNRSAMDAPHVANVSDPIIQFANEYLNETDFIAYDPRFFDIIGSQAKVEHIHQLAYQTHESPCYNAATKTLFFTEWGLPGGDNGTHPWQYLLHTLNNTLTKIQTQPPTVNAHGCVINNGTMYVVTDGDGDKETGALVKINPSSFAKEVILNNYYTQPFLGFNDLDIDSNGNFWLTDSKSAYARKPLHITLLGRDLIDFYYPTNPTVYFVNRTTMRPKAVHITTGNANGVAVSRNPSTNTSTVYLPDTGVSEFKPVSRKNPFGNRALFAYEAGAGGVLSNPRFLNNPISYFYDGIRASRSGLLFEGSGDGVDVIDPVDGWTLGRIRVGGGENLAVSVAW